MPEEKKSSIVSASVNFGMKKEQQAESFQKASLPWNILICADLGYVSTEPEQLRAATLNDFLSSHTVILRGNVKFSNDKQTFIEYPVRDFKDFSSEQIAKNLPLTRDLHYVSQTLHDLLEASITQPQAYALLSKRDCDDAMYREALDLLADKPKQSALKAKPRQADSAKSSVIDSILDSMSAISIDEENKRSSSTPLEKLTDALVGELPDFPKLKIQSLIQRIEEHVFDVVQSLMRQPFFSDCKATWVACRHSAKLAGRSTAAVISVVSVPFSDIDTGFAGILHSCARQNGLPDIVLLDYPFQLTNAHTDILCTIAGEAEKNNSMICASLSRHEPFVARIPGADTLKPIFEEQTFIPFTRLRKNSCARILSLAAPHGVIDSSQSQPVAAGGAWFILFSLLKRICDNRSPFDGGVSLGDMDISAEFPLRYSAGMNREHTLECLEMGITLLSDSVATSAGVPIVTAIDRELAASHYTSFAYNLLVNRLLKITSSVLRRTQTDNATVGEQIRRALVECLAGYRLLHSEDEVSVTVQGNGEVEVVIDSQKSVDEYPIQIQYSLQV